MRHLRLCIQWSAILILLVSMFAFPGTAEASGFVVNALDDVDDGMCNGTHCSLREAINAANANPGPDVIEFDVPDGVSNIIRVTSPLPPLTDDATTIDATTLPYYAGQPEIFIGKDIAVVETGLVIASNNNIIRGLGFAGFGLWPSDPADHIGAILVTGSSNTIELNTIGLAAGPNSTGIRLAGPGNGVLNNVISGNLTGIVADAPDQVIQGNMIGVDADGTTIIGNDSGIMLDGGAEGTLVGGAAPDEGNVISGNNGYGMQVMAGHINIFGNMIGVDSSGAEACPNGADGIMVLFQGSVYIGGGAPGEGNVISGNEGSGISVITVDEPTFIQGNRIGTDNTGNLLIPNSRDGIYVVVAEVIIGGTTSDLGNIIRGNGRYGIWLEFGSDDVSAFIAKNIIAQNAAHGIEAKFNRGSTITQNSIYDNGGLGIRVAGVNIHTLPPVLNGGFGATQTGSACPDCIIEFFLADPDPSGAGEGQTYLDLGYANSNGSFSIPISDLGFCQLITATATNQDTWDTSEFAQNVYANCFQIPPLYLYPIWVFTIVVFGLLGWVVRRRRPDAAGSLTFIMAAGGGLLFLVLILTLPFVHPEFTNPPECGNGVIEGNETCDGDDMTLCRDEQVCENCSCVTVVEEPACGNGVVESGEQCDGDDLTFCRNDQVCENCRCVTSMEAEPPSEGCFYEALSNTYCRVSDYRESDPVAILTEGESALLVGLNPEYTHGLFELESGERCWMWFNTLDGPENPLGTCGVQLVNPPEPPEELVCRSGLDEAACVAAGGQWVVGAAPYCLCP